ncbi:alpha/beta fold hydrolase [Labrenzia sp. PHM005]|uniref:alpha/beta fold hydrolase n=1 Tax=Labrenzia sp. PHM005 TaxID=2590016 RepID=UPI00114024EE|nr:alpha/beta hydrolase [Labrenzia sp. PHM005]QDG78762.1 alpha/beta hydrolase [Labrenzia sp. PHM005]
MQAKIYGKGSPVIVLHEWLGDHRNWEPMLEFCNSKGFEFHCLDLPGYGNSGPHSPEPSAAAIAEEILKYAYSRDLAAFSLVVHSMSGLIGHQLGVTSPERLKNLIFFCPVPPGGFQASAADQEKMQGVSNDRSAIRQAILARGGHLESDEWLDRKEEIAWTASSPETKRAYLKMFLAPLSMPPQKTALEKAYIFCGEADLPFYRKPSLEPKFAPYYANLEIVSLENCGHYPMLQKPKNVAAALLKCLS